MEPNPRSIERDLSSYALRRHMHLSNSCGPGKLGVYVNEDHLPHDVLRALIGIGSRVEKFHLPCGHHLYMQISRADKWPD